MSLNEPNENVSLASARPLGGHYQLVRRLASGGFGQTFIARDLHLPGLPLCVVKQLKAQRDPETLRIARRLFEQEAKVLYSLAHSQIPKLLAHFEEAEEFYLVQELVVGEPLSRKMVPGDCWSEDRAIALLKDILDVLSYVHQQGVIHRDIKPDNLLQTENGKIVLIDFGAVKALPQAASAIATDSRSNSKPSTLTVVVGTAGYMPVEQRGGKPRFSSDLYAVGMTLIQAVTGLSLDRLTHSEQTGEIEWLAHAPQISPELGELIGKMVRYDFRHRYIDAKAAMTALSRFSTALSSAQQSLRQKVAKGLEPAGSEPAHLEPNTSEAPPLKTTTLGTIRRRLPAIAPIAILGIAGGLFAVSNFLSTYSVSPLDLLVGSSTPSPSVSMPVEDNLAESSPGSLDSSTPEPLDSQLPNLDSATPQNWAMTIEGIEQGNAAFDERSYQTAIDEYLDALVNLRETGQPPELSDEALEDVHRRVCYSLHRVEQFAQADEACADALVFAEDRVAQQPDSAIAYYGRAQALAGLRRFSDAQADIKQAQSLATETSLKADLLQLQIEVAIDQLEAS